MKEAVIQIRMKGEPLCQVIRGCSGLASVRDIRTSSSGEGFQHLVEVRSTGRSVLKVMKELRRADGIREVEVAYLGREKAIALITNTGCPVCKAAYGSGYFIRSVASQPSSDIEWRILLRRGQSVNRFLDGFAKEGLDARVAEVKEVKGFNRTTSRQEEVLRWSLAAGYFDFPRRIGVKELAHIFGVAPSTLSETIRRGEKNALGEYLAYQGRT